VVPAQRRPQERAQRAQERTVGDDAPVEAHVGGAFALGQRPRAPPPQVAVDVALHDLGRFEANDLRARVQVIRQAALEVLARDLADGGLAVGFDVDVDGAPPLRVGACVGDGSEDLLARRGDVPFVDEAVLGGADPQQRAGERALDRERRLRRVALVGEVTH